MTTILLSWTNRVQCRWVIDIAYTTLCWQKPCKYCCICVFHPLFCLPTQYWNNHLYFEWFIRSEFVHIEWIENIFPIDFRFYSQCYPFCNNSFKFSILSNEKKKNQDRIRLIEILEKIKLNSAWYSGSAGTKHRMKVGKT